MTWCFGLDAVSYLFVLGRACSRCGPAELHAQPRTTRERGHIVAGLQYVWRTDDLRRPLIVLAVMFTFVFNWQVLMPLLAEVAFNAGREGVRAALGRGRRRRVRRRDDDRARQPRPGMGRLGVFSLLVGGSMMLVVLAPTLRFAMLAMVPLGYAAMCFMITGNTMLQLNAKPQARGRVMALYGIVFLGSTPIGAPIAGWLGEMLGPRVEFALMGARRSRSGRRPVAARSPLDRRR